MKQLVIALVLLAFMTACSSEPSKPVEQAKPAAPTTDEVTGRSGFQRLYVAAHAYAPDVQPFRLESQVTADSKGKGGKAAVWRTSFASASRRATKPYVWSGSTDPNAPSRGVSPGTEDNYNPSNTSTRAFDVAFLKIDSDKALEVAQKHGGDKLTAKAPDTPVFYVLDWSTPTSELVWHVIYGDSRDNPKLKVAVNASSGEFIRVEK